MALSSDTSKNLVIAAALIGALGILAVRRVPRWLGEPVRFSDGVEVYGDVRAEGVRHAVWDAPLDLGGEVNSPAHEARPALSPDGRWLVFASRGEGSDWDLWVAELEQGRALAPRPLAALNTASDDMSPAFGPEGLYLASNRPGGAGGFDLWVAPFEDGQAGAARPLEPGVNTAFDELDPAPGRTPQGEPLLVFASDRRAPGTALGAVADGGGLDLFMLWPERRGADALRALDELNTPADEREPCLAADGESLFFASGAGGVFALRRSFRDGERWLAPRPLAGLGDDQPRRAPLLAADGFTLYFEAARSDLTGAVLDPGDLFWARSRELYPLAPDDLGWKDLLLVALLLATALLAWLAKRWHELDVLYKCVLISVLVHLLAMWLLREVRPESSPLPPGEDGGPTFRVQVLRDSSLAAAQSERGGALEAARSEPLLLADPTRVQLAQSAAAPASAPAAALQARASELAAAPRQLALEAQRSSAPAGDRAPALRAPAETFERLAQAAPSAAPAAPAALEPAARLVVRAPVGEPAATPFEVADASRSAVRAPATGELARPVAAEVSAPGFARSESERAAGAQDARAPEVAALSESFAPLSAPESRPEAPRAQAFEPGAPSARAAELDGPGRVGEALALAAPVRAAESAPQSTGVERRSEPVPAAPAPRSDSGREASRTQLSAAAPALAAPSETFQPLARSESAAAPAPPRPAAASFAPERSTARAQPAPRRLESEVERSATPEPTPAPVEALAARPREDDKRLPEAPGRLFDTPYRTRFGSQKSTALREHGGGADTEAAVARGLAYLASIQNEDGSWGNPRARHDKYRQVAIGKTGLALLAFLGAGHTPGEGSYARVADAAVTFLLRSQGRRNGHFGDSAAYGHGIATYALAECFALTHEERLRAPLEAAIERILAAQFTRGDRRLVGGWSYYYRDDSTFDEWPRASITAWQVMALESARLGGLEVPDGAFEAAREYLVRSWDPRMGAFRYSHDPARTRSNFATLPGSTPAALFALALLGEDLESDPYRPARDYLSERAPAGYRYRGDDAFVQRASGNLYFWYYGTLASFRLGGRPWQRWNTALKETLLPSQEADGSWVPLDIYAREYAGDRDGDRSYTTALNVLSLEVYYRYFTPLLRVR